MAKTIMEFQAKYMRKAEPGTPLQEPLRAWPLGIVSDPAYLAEQERRNASMRNALAIMQDAKADAYRITGVKERDLGKQRPKPRMSLKHGVWGCWSVERPVFPRGWVAGYGYSPADAYRDWFHRWEEVHGTRGRNA